MRVSEPLPKKRGDERNKEQEVPEDKEEGPIKGQDSTTRHTQTNSLCLGGPAWEGASLFFHIRIRVGVQAKNSPFSPNHPRP